MFLFTVFTLIFLRAFVYFLALLDYVSRAHEIAICASSVLPSSVRVAIISELNAWISFKF